VKTPRWKTKLNGTPLPTPFEKFLDLPPGQKALDYMYIEDSMILVKIIG
jgi:hypothetical protein